jgi:hypothetical protein
MLIVGRALGTLGTLMTLGKRPLRRSEVVLITVIRIAVIITLVRLGLIEPARSIKASLTFHAGHPDILRLRGHNDAIIVLGVLKIVLGSHRVTG